MNKHNLPLLTGVSVYLYFMIPVAAVYIGLSFSPPLRGFESTLAFIVGAYFGMIIFAILRNVYANTSGIFLPELSGNGSLVYLDAKKLKSHKLKKASLIRSWMFVITSLIFSGLLGGALAIWS